MFKIRRSGCLSWALPFVVYSGLAVVILWDLLLPGYVLALDMVFTPKIPFPREFYGFDADPIRLVGLPFRLFLWALNLVLPAWLIQKILLFVVFLFSGLGAHHLCEARSSLGRFYAGFMYVLNPFVYVRFMVGHLWLLLGYSVLPFLIKSFIGFLEEPKLDSGVRFALLLTLVLVLDAHYVYIAGLALLFLFVFKILSLKEEPQKIRRITSGVVFSAVIFAGLNVYWLASIFLLGTETRVSTFSYRDLLAFASKAWGTGVNIFFSLAALYGFWRVPEGYRYVCETLPGWQLIYLLILYLSVYGFMVLREDRFRSWISNGIAMSGVVSLLLAAGISSTITAPLFEALFSYLPFFSGMREPQKFLAVLALTYSFLGGYGLSEHCIFLKKFTGESKRVMTGKFFLIIFLVATLASPFIYSYRQLFGFYGQIRNLEYPDEWYEAKEFLDSDKSDYRVLYLPWHLYMRQSWIGRITANPAPKFFGKPFLAGENMEWMGIETQSRKPEQHYMPFLLDNMDINQIKNFGELIAPLNIKYIVLLKEVDYKKYNFLYNQEDLEVVFENAKIVLFENQHDVARIYWVKNVRNMRNWSQIFDISRNENLLGSLYLEGYVKDSDFSEQIFRPLSYVFVSPLIVEVEVPEDGYLIFTDPYDKGWLLNDTKPVANLGLTNAFRVNSPGTIKIYYQKFNSFIPFYIGSAATFFVCLAFLFLRKIINDEKKQKLIYERKITAIFQGEAA
ncbi:MAG: hypothetical protein ACTSVW_05110 [Candidatus Njordarchaeales archaeon]